MSVGSIFRFSDADEVEGTKIATADSREQGRRDESLRLAMGSSWPEIPRTRLRFERFHVVDEATGELYTLVRGEVDGKYSPVAAYVFDEDGGVQFLERYAGARTVDELAAQRAAREQARAERLRPRGRR